MSLEKVDGKVDWAGGRGREEVDGVEQLLLGSEEEEEEAWRTTVNSQFSSAWRSHRENSVSSSFSIRQSECGCSNTCRRFEEFPFLPHSSWLLTPNLQLLFTVGDEARLTDRLTQTKAVSKFPDAVNPSPVSSSCSSGLFLLAQSSVSWIVNPRVALPTVCEVKPIVKAFFFFTIFTFSKQKFL